MKEVIKNKKIVIPALLVCIAILLFLGLLLVNKFTLELKVEAEDTVYLEYGDAYENPTATAKYKGSIISLFDKDVKVEINGKVDEKKLGEYELTYIAKYKDRKATKSIKIVIQDTLAPEINLISDPDGYTSPIAEYEEEGYTAIDNYDGDITEKVEVIKGKDFWSYKVIDSAGNEAVVRRNIIYKDKVEPVITLAGGENVTCQLGAKEYVDAGASALDDCDGDLTDSIEVSGTVDTSVVGEYKIEYTVKDSSGNEAKVTRTVKVADTEAPVITLAGESKIYLKKGENYSEPGYSAWDSYDGDKTAAVSVSGNVDTSNIGIYSIKYSVTDASGNTGTAIRQIFVFEKQATGAGVNPGDKVVYLTFDDGPGPYTAKLLDILDKYGVKVTFFVTNQKPDFQYLIAEEYKRGHTVALHTYTHRYETVYASVESYFNDLNSIAAVAKSQTGVDANIIRFPGGSSNTISKKYRYGIMSELTGAVGKMGYYYCDWNVSSGDGGGNIGTQAVKNNVINGIQSHNVSVVLQHDIHEFSVNAVEDIIIFGLANGYVFLPMDETTPMVHHGVNN